MDTNSFFALDGPLDSMPASRQMRTANLSGFSGLVRSMGVDPVHLLEQHDIDPAALRDPDHFVDCKSVVDLFEHSSSVLNDPLFGLRLAQIQDPEVFGCIATLCRAAPTVREAVLSFIEYLPVVHSPEAHIELVEGENNAEIRWMVGADLGFNHQANYKGALLNLKLLQMVAGEDFRASYVNLAATPKESDIPELERNFGCRFHRTRTENAIGFPAAVLQQPIATTNRLVFRLLGGYLEQVKSAARVSVADRVEDFVRYSLAAGNCCIERCSTKLGISVRTLQAQLGESGLKFSDILERQRFELAKSYLEQPHLSLDDVAEMLGYAEQSSFGRAFKRWSGLTPRLYRQQVESKRGAPMPAAFSMAFANRSAGI